MTEFDPAANIAARATAFEEPPIIVMAQKARELRARGFDVVSLTIGEPDFDTPRYIRSAAVKAMDDGFTHYAPMPGFPELRQAIADKLRSENGLDYTTDEVVLSNGAKQSITNTMYALLEPGDEVILLAPFWAAYQGIVEFAGGVAKILHAGAEDNFKVPAERIAAAMTGRTKMIVVNSPGNPSGAVYTRDELTALADIIRPHPRAFMMSDEIYEYIMFEGEHVSFATLPGMRDRTVTINGFSKGFAMTGWRLGYAAAPATVARAIAKIQGTFTAGANAFVQQAAIAALAGDRSDVEDMRASYLRRRDLLLDGLKEIPGVVAPKPRGAFYLFCDVGHFLGRRAGNHHIETVTDLAHWLLEKHHVATVPGTAFGDANCLRLSFAASDEDIGKGVERIIAGLGELAA